MFGFRGVKADQTPEFCDAIRFQELIEEEIYGEPGQTQSALFDLLAHNPDDVEQIGIENRYETKSAGAECQIEISVRRPPRIIRRQIDQRPTGENGRDFRIALSGR
jgi:hypothetical protein